MKIDPHDVGDIDFYRDLGPLQRLSHNSDLQEQELKEVEK